VAGAQLAARLVDAVHVRLEPGAEVPLALPGTRNLSRSDYLRQLTVAPDLNAAADYLLVAIVTAYTAERRPEFRLLRLLGMTRRQVLRMVVWETGIVAAPGSVIAVTISGIALLGVTRAWAATCRHCRRWRGSACLPPCCPRTPSCAGPRCDTVERRDIFVHCRCISPALFGGPPRAGQLFTLLGREPIGLAGTKSGTGEP
jgi:hypothetical protein